MFRTCYTKTHMSTYFRIAKWLLLLPLLGIAIVSNGTLFPFIVGKYVWFRATVDLALLSFLTGLLLHDANDEMWKRVKEVMRRPLVIAVSLFVLAFLLACIFGVDPMMSFWSNFERGEGGLQLIHFWIWFTLLITLYRDEKDWNALFTTALAGGVLMAGYGFLAAFGFKSFIGPKLLADRFSGSIGNAAYTAAYSIFMLFYIGYLLMGKYRNALRSTGAFVLYGLVALFLTTFLLAATRGAFVGLVVALIAFLGFFVYTHKAWRKWLIAAILAIVLFVGAGVAFQDSAFMKAIPGSRIFDLSVTTQTFSDRTIMWHIALEGFKVRPIFGWGPENYISIFDRHLDDRYFKPAAGFGAWFDRAHSVYFDYLAETGIVGLLAYLGMFITFYYSFFKTRVGESVLAGKAAPLQALLFSILFAYLVQGFVLFDVSPIYMNVFLILAFGAYNFSSRHTSSHIASTHH